MYHKLTLGFQQLKKSKVNLFIRQLILNSLEVVRLHLDGRLLGLGPERVGIKNLKIEKTAKAQEAMLEIPVPI